MNTNPNDPAAPSPAQYSPVSHELLAESYFGLTKLEAFTIAAMQNVSIHDIDFGTLGAPAERPFDWHAEQCVAFARAVIAELNKQP